MNGSRRHKHDIILGICKVITDGELIPSDLMVECEGTERERLIRQLPRLATVREGGRGTPRALAGVGLEGLSRMF
jgi:hypothetical protein